MRTMEITLLTVLGTIVVSLLATGGLILGNISGRLHKVEEELAKERAYNRLIWLWARRFVDQYYKWRREGAPDPPPLPEQE